MQAEQPPIPVTRGAFEAVGDAGSVQGHTSQGRHLKRCI